MSVTGVPRPEPGIPAGSGNGTTVETTVFDMDCVFTCVYGEHFFVGVNHPICGNPGPGTFTTLHHQAALRIVR